MPRGDKSAYTSRQKRKAEHIETGYKKRGVSSREAERRAWATVNKQEGGGRKSSAHRRRGAKSAPASRSTSRRAGTRSGRRAGREGGRTAGVTMPSLRHPGRKVPVKEPDGGRKEPMREPGRPAAVREPKMVRRRGR